MTVPNNPSELFSPFLPATYTIPEDPDRLTTFLVDKLSLFAEVINDKNIGVWTDTVSSLNGNKFSYDTTSKVRTGYNYLARIDSYPSSGTIVLPVPPNFNSQFALFQAWGSASLPATTPGTGNFFSFMSQGDSRISFVFTDQSITITTTALGSGYSGFLCVSFISDGV